MNKLAFISYELVEKTRTAKPIFRMGSVLPIEQDYSKIFEFYRFYLWGEYVPVIKDNEDFCTETLWTSILYDQISERFKVTKPNICLNSMFNGHNINSIYDTLVSLTREYLDPSIILRIQKPDTKLMYFHSSSGNFYTIGDHRLMTASDLLCDI